MRDAVAAFYDPYARGFTVRRWIRSVTTHRRFGWGALAIALVSVLLVGLVAADASAFYSIPTKVTITGIQWFVGNFSVGNQSGFTVLGGHTFVEQLVCQIFCPTFTSATINSPFALVNDTLAYPWFEYANLTVRAPTSAYSGPLSIAFGV